MPQRSNDFQRLMYFIYSQLAPIGAKVSESVLLKERDSASPREIDILLETDVIGTRVRIAVECRDRTRIDDIEWIDSLIGKFKDLDVNVVIAVSASGFSAPAREKARANNIDARTLDDALETSWPAEFMKIGVALFKQQIQFVRAVITTEPPYTGKFNASDLILDEGGNLLGTMGDFIGFCFTQHSELKARQHLDTRFLTIFKTLADLYKEAMIVHSAKPAPMIHVVAAGQRHSIISLEIQMRCTPTVEKPEVKHRLYDNAYIATANVVRHDGSEARLHAVQIAGRGSINVSLTEKCAGRNDSGQPEP